LSGWLLDTNVISELRRPRPERKVLAFLATQPLEALHISVVTLAEIRFGIAIVSEPMKRAELSDWLTHNVRPMFEKRRMPLDEDVIVKWRLIVEEGRRRRHTHSQPDLFIAATAICHQMTVVSRNVAHFERAGAAVLDPWK
jgi:predicted nucleic acid-binding protein